MACGASVGLQLSLANQRKQLNPKIQANMYVTKM